jgi:hypothetical protein
LEINAKRLFDHLEQAGFVVLKRQPIAGGGSHPFGARRFGEELERQGYAACKLTGGARGRRGLRLKPPTAMSRFAVIR